MTGRDLPYTIGLSLVAVAALGLGIYVMAGGEVGRITLGAIALLIALLSIIAIANFASIRAHAREDRSRLVGDLRADLVSFDKRLHGEAQRNEELAALIDDLREGQTRHQAALSASVDEIKSSYGEITGQVRQVADFVASAVQESQTAAAQATAYYQHAYTAPPEMASVPANDMNDQAGHESVGEETQLRPTIEQEPVVYLPPPATEQLLTSLEPVVDLFTNRTAHYRLLLSMQKSDEVEVPTDTLLHHADRTGLREQFDIHATREALGLLRFLRQRDSQLNIFMPVGANTLQSAETLSSLLQIREEFKDVAAGLVYEFSHASLAGLSERGLEGLAMLARRGVLLAITNAAMAGIDANALGRLNVRFLSLSGSSVLANNGPSAQFLAFAQMVRANRIQLIATNVLNAAEAPKLSKATRYASGPGFAPPRRVKTGVAAEAISPFSNVA
jgi:EAL domain-containing protein (putative c-di-GMP-specific phosphodiesterase class I)